MAKVKRILVPVDFSWPSRSALEHARKLAAASGAAIEVLHVFEGLSSAVPAAMTSSFQQTGEGWERLREHLVRELDTFAGGGIPVRVDAGLASEVIASTARGGRFDLVVMGTHGATGRFRPALGSVADGVMRKAPCPVLTVHVPGRVSHEAAMM